MSKKKKNAFFQVQNQRSPQVAQQDQDKQEHPQDDQEQFSPEHHKIQKRELISVFLVILVIILAFSTMWLTNRKNNWINNVSEKTAKKLIRGF